MKNSHTHIQSKLIQIEIFSFLILFCYTCMLLEAISNVKWKFQFDFIEQWWWCSFAVDACQIKSYQCPINEILCYFEFKYIECDWELIG
jgi:hypothetical protein